MDHFELLEDFTNERDSIRRKKESGESVLTLDPVLAKYRFCNVRRRDDRVSRWLLRYYYKDLTGDVWFRALLARLINWPPTLLRLTEAKVIPTHVEEFNPYEFLSAMADIETTKEKMYSSAYIVYPTNVAGNTKSINLTQYIIMPTVAMRDVMRNEIADESVEGFTTKLSSSFGIKTFLAGQVAADLTYLRGQLDNATDLYSWAPMGPGSQRGLNRLHKRPLKKSMSQEQFNAELTEVRGRLIRSNGAFRDLTLHDVQNVMCEFDKYLRVLMNEGAPRQLYKSERAF